MRAPRQAKQAAEAPKQARYWPTDPDSTELAGRRLSKQDHKDGILLTESEAMHYVASGAVSTSDPAADEAARKAVEKKDNGTPGTGGAPKAAG